ncbi:hypothetical protein [Bacillus sp. B1-b2]|uniref:hypothetical protein n=1 Tax=Bacillus sp. B1-b2 TaxID=2653201 RepID=UPI001262065D|nr:hypothetical protein [Bacillus sp. B1-b2]KAB7667716.1 hypothetical protein F9279_14405 [Bacillus sp. B1-b2]
MGTTNIKMDVHDLQATLQKLESSMDEFRSYTDNFRSGTRDQLKSFNSDFIEKVDAVLENMNDDINSDLLKNLEDIHRAGKKILDEMKKADEEVGEMIRSGQS